MRRRRSAAELRRAHAEYLADEGLRFAGMAAQFAAHPAWLRRQWLDLRLSLPAGRDCSEYHCLVSRADVLAAWERYPAVSADDLAAELGMRSDSLRKLWRDAGLVARDRRRQHREGQIGAAGPHGSGARQTDEDRERQWRLDHPGKGGLRRKLSDERAIELFKMRRADPRLTVGALAEMVGVTQPALSRRWQRMGL